MENDQNMNRNEQQFQTDEQSQQGTQQYQPVQQFQQGQQYQGQQYQGQAYQQQYQNMGPLLKTDRSVWKFLLFSILTCGIYALVFFSGISDDINRVATGRDRKKTTHFCLMAFVLGPITCGIYEFYWWHTFSERIGDEARARGIYTNFGAATFWLWYFLGSLLCGIGPLIYVHMLCETMNQINSSYNQFGR